jgi:hypothetical protein
MHSYSIHAAASCCIRQGCHAEGCAKAGQIGCIADGVCWHLQTRPLARVRRRAGNDNKEKEGRKVKEAGRLKLNEIQPHAAYIQMRPRHTDTCLKARLAKGLHEPHWSRGEQAG